ncbi:MULTISPECIES: Rev-Erb beta 2 [Bacillus cereus group]|uniref:Rev-Erb beta 2 n=1 Tax=Bacillus thuringiensis subsp. jegathesan TaxID=56955 RepID=A0A9X6MGQ5_BACTJ|nr:Rev-Erb beta 2 [Bacillus thuringiensis]OUB76816.1 Rev-Erb beta 2 [Bacillus thuringiensis serovar jegathesan]HDR7768288.1 Rev-Erb beta 2 [Bacillus paranthracis]
MTIQVHKCNNEGCKGVIRYDNTNINYKKAVNESEGIIDTVQCNQCYKKFTLVVTHALIDTTEDGEYLNTIPSLSIN